MSSYVLDVSESFELWLQYPMYEPTILYFQFSIPLNASICTTFLFLLAFLITQKKPYFKCLEF